MKTGKHPAGYGGCQGRHVVVKPIRPTCDCAPAPAGQNPATQAALDTFAEGCQQELTTLCKDVTPGEGRLLDYLKKTRRRSVFAATMR